MQNVSTIGYRLLLVEDDVVDASIVERELTGELKPYPAIKVVPSLDECLKALSQSEYDAVLVDLNLPDSTGIETARQIIDSATGSAVIVLTGSHFEELGLQAVASGAQDFLCKDQLGSKQLARIVKYAVERVNLFRQYEEAREENLAAASQEQLRIARELHDGVCQIQTAIGAKGRALESLLKAEGHEAHSLASELVQLIQAQANEIHAAVRGIAPLELDQAGLSNALLKLTKQWNSSNGVKCQFLQKGCFASPTSHQALQLYRIGQEAVHNAVRHSRASSIKLFLQGNFKRLALQVHDNGCGFDPQRKLNSPRSLGLNSMINRALAIGGKLTIKSQPDEGTVVLCTVQIQRTQTKLYPTRNLREAS